MKILVNPNGTKWWRLKYRFAGKEKVLALGVYPDVSLAEARQKRDEAKWLLANNVDPNRFKKQKRREARAAVANSFENVAREWHAKYSGKWSEGHVLTILARLEFNIFPW